MPLSRTRDYLSIGEVLTSVRTDFPDISISKIRFLESEGLISPERTASGYRKFFEGDVERLRYVLTLQRDHFLPLKVIKERLSAGGDRVDLSLPSESNGKPQVDTSARPSVSVQSDVHLSRDELMRSADLSAGELATLEDFGVLPQRDDGYDGDDLTIARAAQGFFGYGVEARHLKMYRQFAERELSFFEQITEPMNRKGDGESLGVAADTGRRLGDLARSMHDAMLRSAARGR